MFNKIWNWIAPKTEDVMTATITPFNGKFALISRSGEVLQTYSRERDARRGATRRGFFLA